MAELYAEKKSLVYLLFWKYYNELADWDYRMKLKKNFENAIEAFYPKASNKELNEIIGYKFF